MAPPDHDTEVKSAVAIALLQQNYMHLEEKMDALHADTKDSIVRLGDAVTKLGDQFNVLITQNADRTAKERMHAKIWMAARHAGTVGLTLLAAKLMHVPIDPNG
jgi:hypothetical protein